MTIKGNYQLLMSGLCNITVRRYMCAILMHFYPLSINQYNLKINIIHGFSHLQKASNAQCTQACTIVNYI